MTSIWVFRLYSDSYLPEIWFFKEVYTQVDMSNSSHILAGIRSIPSQGGKLLGNNWPQFVDTLRQHLARAGHVVNSDSNDLLLFSFSDLRQALSAIIFGLKETKKLLDWQQGYGNVPVQIVLHPEGVDEAPFGLKNGAAPFWEHLLNESIYITQVLQKDWGRLQDEQKLPAHEPEGVGGKYFRLVVDKLMGATPQRLFLHRILPIQGDQDECFYCAMTNHEPGECPSKYLTLDTGGLDDVGYLPFKEINLNYQQAFADYLGTLKTLIAGVKPKQIRKDKGLLTFVSYLDIYRIFQPRFLWHITFSDKENWEELSPANELTFDCKNLQLGLDCLRVGDYDKARKLLTAESRKKSEGKAFYANVGLAFLAVENGKANEIRRYLENANALAVRQKEKVYISLLLSRYYEMSDAKWQVKELVSSASTLCYDSLDTQYRMLQASVLEEEGITQSIKLLRSLLVGNREIFIALLMDPALIPLQGTIDVMAQEEFRRLQKEATQNLSNAGNEFNKMRQWFPPDDKFIHDEAVALNKLNKQLQRESYYDMLDVEDRSQGIIQTCSRVLTKRKEEFSGKLQELGREIKECKAFWQDFSYKRFFKSFHADLLTINEEFKKLKKMAQSDCSRAFIKANVLVDPLWKKVHKMVPRRKFMSKVALWGYGANIFCKRLLTLELLILTAGLLYYFVKMNGGGGVGHFADLNRVKGFVLLGLIVFGPCTALSWTVMGQLKGKESL